MEFLHRDELVVAVNKPAGVATIPGRAEKTSVLEQVGEALGLPAKGTADPRVRVVHRLDKDTSGVLLFALNTEAQRHLSHQFQNNTVRKEYLALVVGAVPGEEGVIDEPLAPHPQLKDRMTVMKHGRRALTEWRVEERFRQFTLLRAFPKTGKTHQIRVHLKHAGVPLAVDPLYNPARGREAAAGVFLSGFKRDYRPTRGEEERPLIARLTLHAERVIFTHPNGTELTVAAPLPKDFRATLNQLRRHGGR